MSNGPQETSAPAKKGLSPLAWVGIGCGVLILLGVVAAVAMVGLGVKMVKDVAESDSVQDVLEDFNEDPARAAAELAVRLNPDLELVESDREEGKMTIKNLQTGEVITVDYRDITEGRLRFESKEGVTEIDAGGTPEGGEVKITTPEGETRFGTGSLDELPDWVLLYPDARDARSSYSSSRGGQSSGAVTATTDDDAETVLDHYEEELGDDWRILNRTTSGGVGSLTAQTDKRTLQVVVTPGTGGNQIVVSYSG